MSTAAEDSSSDQPQCTSQQPGALAILTATAVGGVIATRVGKTPLLLAAGIAAFALLQQKRPASQPGASLPPPDPDPVPVPPVENLAQSQVEQWLSQQLSRDELAPAVDLSAVVDPAPAPEDDYQPPAFLLDELEDFPALSPADHSFAQLADPVEWHVPVVALENEEQAEPPAPSPPPPVYFTSTPVYSPPPPVYSAPSPVFSAPSPVYSAPSSVYSVPPSEDSSWALGVEPLPSLNVAAPFSCPSPTSSMFFAAPVQEEPVEQLPPAAVFEGAAFPDEINVIPSIEPVVHLTPSVVEGFSPTVKSPEPEPFRATEPSLAAETVADAPKEIDVHLAAPGEGEASFDPPLAAAQQNPWESELELPPPHSVVPSHSALTHPVIEAEIILRPRAPTQNTVTTKAKPSPLLTIKKDFAESFDTPPAVAAQDALIPSQPEIPAEPKTRSSWRSWWRGD